MTANTQDMIAQLMAQAQAPQAPGFLGLQAPPDQGQMQQLLAQLQGQQAVQDTPDVGGRRAFASLGQQVGQALGTATNPAVQQPAPSPIKDALANAQAIYSKVLDATGDETKARQTALAVLAKQGVPGAAEKLQAAQSDALKAGVSNSEIDKNTQQARTSEDERAHRLEQEKNSQWKVIQANGEYQVLENANGDRKSVKVSDKASLPDNPVDAQNRSDVAKHVANYDISIQDALSRANPAERAKFLAEVYRINPEYSATSYSGSQAAYKNFVSGGAQSPGAMARFSVNVAAHTYALEKAHDALQAGDIKRANAIAQAVGRETGDGDITSYDTLASIVAKEGVKALVPNAGGVKEREAQEQKFLASLAGDQLKKNTGILRSAVKVQYDNIEQQYAKTTFKKNFKDIWTWPTSDVPGSTADAPPAPGKIINFSDLNK